MMGDRRPYKTREHHSKSNLHFKMNELFFKPQENISVLKPKESKSKLEHIDHSPHPVSHYSSNLKGFIMPRAIWEESEDDSPMKRSSKFENSYRSDESASKISSENVFRHSPNTDVEKRLSLMNLSKLAISK